MRNSPFYSSETQVHSFDLIVGRAGYETPPFELRMDKSARRGRVVHIQEYAPVAALSVVVADEVTGLLAEKQAVAPPGLF